MHDRSRSSRIEQPVSVEGIESRLSWLLYANHCEVERQRLFRRVGEEEEMLMMRRPIPAEKAFALFGLLLGTLPPAAIFFKIFGGVMVQEESAFFMLIIVLSMNAGCGLAGTYLGSKLSRIITTVERESWSSMLIVSPIIGVIWGTGAGAAGGFVAWGIGAIFGVVCAIPVGMLAFGLFVPLHRLLARGGMIDARHFWPLACGVVLLITALILGL